MSSWLICDDSIQRGSNVDAAQRKVVRKVARTTPRTSHFRCDINALWAESVKPSEIFAEPRSGIRRLAEDLSDRARGRSPRRHETSCMSRRILPAPPALRQLAIVGLASMLASAAFAAEPNFPITPQQRATAQKAAEAGVPLSELLPNAPDIYTVKTRDTLWGISSLYLKSPWRWPELWGMNMDQVRNPHLIFPGQVLFLDKSDGRARLRMGQQVGGGVTGDGKLQPHVRAKDIAFYGIASIPFNLIEPFLNEAVIFETNQLAAAPRIVATQ